MLSNILELDEFSHVGLFLSRTVYGSNNITIYTVSQKNIPDVFSYNSIKH